MAALDWDCTGTGTALLAYRWITRRALSKQIPNFEGLASGLWALIFGSIEFLA